MVDVACPDGRARVGNRRPHLVSFKSKDIMTRARTILTIVSALLLVFAGLAAVGSSAQAATCLLYTSPSPRD